MKFQSSSFHPIGVQIYKAPWPDTGLAGTAMFSSGDHHQTANVQLSDLTCQEILAFVESLLET